MANLAENTDIKKQTPFVRLLFYSDTHLGFEFPFNPRSAHRHRGHDFFANFHYVYNYARENNIRFVIHGGDLFYRSKIPDKLVNFVYTALLEYAGMGIVTFIVPGNHERGRLPQSLLMNHPNLKIFSRAQTFYEQLDDVAISFSGFPFVRENIHRQFPAVLKNSGWFSSRADVKLLCLHQAIQGAQVGLHNYTFRAGKDVIAMKDLPHDASAILCGHIHRRQVLYSPEKIPVIHAGSIERTSFAERNEPKGFYDLLFYQNKDAPEIRFINLPARPMYDVLVEEDHNDKVVLKEIERLAEHLPLNAVVRFRSGAYIPLQQIRAVVPESMTVYYLPEKIPDKAE